MTAPSPPVEPIRMLLARIRSVVHLARSVAARS
jgi:hypothetical protein